MRLKSITTAAETRGLIVYRAIWRWHFYAGLFCLPFILILEIGRAHV